METYIPFKIDFLHILDNDWVLIPFVISAVIGVTSIITFTVILIFKCCKSKENFSIEEEPQIDIESNIIESDTTDQRSDNKNSIEYESPDSDKTGRKNESLKNRCSRFITQAQAYPSKFLNRKLPEIPTAFANPQYIGRPDLSDKGAQRSPVVVKASSPYDNPKLSPFDMEKLQTTPKGYLIMNRIQFPSRAAPKLHAKPTMPVKPYESIEQVSAPGTSSRQYRRQ